MLNFTIIFGFLSLAQTIFLPGYLLLKILQIKLDYITTAIISFVLSLFINYLLVFSMVLSNTFSTFNVRIVLCIEIIFFLLLLLKNKNNTSNFNKMLWLKNVKTYEIIALGLIIYTVCYSLGNFGHVFKGWDTICSWNKWAINLYDGILPVGTGTYPQIIPSNFAIMYAVTGYPLQFFPYFMWNVIPIYCLLIPYSMAKSYKKNENEFYLSVIGVFFFIMPLIRDAGYADLPVAFVSLASFYYIFIISKSKNIDTSIFKNAIILGIVLGCATVTKQAGLFILIVSPVFIYLLIIKNKQKRSSKFKIIIFTIPLFVSLSVVISWYFAARYLPRDNNINHLLNLTWSGGFLGLINWAIIHKFKLLNFIILLISISFSWKSKFCRSISLLVVIPYFIVWILCFGYDARNISVLLPFAGILFGFALSKIISLMSPLDTDILTKIKKVLFYICNIAHGIIIFIFTKLINKKAKKIYVLSSLILFFLFLFCPLFSKDNIVAFQNYMAISSIGGSKFSKANIKIYKMIQENEIKGKVFTNYQLSTYLPAIGDYFIYKGINSKFPNKKFIDEHNIEYLLLTYLSNSDILEINKHIKSGYFKQIYNHRKVYLLKIN